MRSYRLAMCGFAAAAGLLSFAGPVQGFYWYGWPGSKLPPDRTVITPPNDDRPGNPPDRPPVNPPPEQPPPNNPTPEPATAVVALAGLGAIAVRRLLRQRK
jgi:MYXO-CTERM domain-containing protein